MLINECMTILSVELNQLKEYWLSQAVAICQKVRDSRNISIIIS